MSCTMHTLRTQRQTTEATRVRGVCETEKEHTHCGRRPRVEAVITKSFEEWRLSYTGVSHHYNLKKSVGRWGTAFLLQIQKERQRNKKKGEVNMFLNANCQSRTCLHLCWSPCQQAALLETLGLPFLSFLTVVLVQYHSWLGPCSPPSLRSLLPRCTPVAGFGPGSCSAAGMGSGLPRWRWSSASVLSCSVLWSHWMGPPHPRWKKKQNEKLLHF